MGHYCIKIDYIPFFDTMYTHVLSDLTYYVTLKFYSLKRNFIIYLMYHASFCFERPDYIRLTSFPTYSVIPSSCLKGNKMKRKW